MRLPFSIFPRSQVAGFGRAASARPNKSIFAFEQLEDRNLLTGVYQFSGAASGFEGADYLLNLTSDQAVTQWQINWGDGNLQTVSGNPASVHHAFVDNGAYNITATATDSDGEHSASVVGQVNSQQLDVAIANVAPVLHISGPAQINGVFLLRRFDRSQSRRVANLVSDSKSGWRRL